ncbi:hypothetical protein [Tuwongella immobilis]|uniref:Uncharacterized protein n=1 Tax=Tuwongella immobilis TaxID=692036 RepID=A0A6C2YJJ0_9BACT|nr:hypothetical protein [Tuwongella immobilis]VIP01740.1 Uncharacterized protein OS=Chthoniobacter flavus Ellin428 GN=CfE428DRAFT_1000 PE=4 SV=1 [Tuwongella immobilis]VTR99308.1 Uncharacterized protein OS=Chthoniobacter flavus Ellin428 GN=CfE428DRAFT_1000 PE=4 SV=1 [Tuwongella immobilis]
MTEGCTPLEVLSVLELRDHDLAARCLEVIRLHVAEILPVGTRYRVEVIQVCHHHPQNVYPALGLFGPHTMAEFREAEQRIAAWVAERGLDWLVAASAGVTTPPWAGHPNPKSR